MTTRPTTHAVVYDPSTGKILRTVTVTTPSMVAVQAQAGEAVIEDAQDRPKESFYIDTTASPVAAVSRPAGDTSIDTLTVTRATEAVLTCPSAGTVVNIKQRINALPMGLWRYTVDDGSISLGADEVCTLYVVAEPPFPAAPQSYEIEVLP